MVDWKKSIDLKSESNREFFLIHGYSGSPTDFGEFPYYLHKKFKANVKCMLLPGHGTTLEDLEKYELEDFIKVLEEELKKDLKKGKEIILMGTSFGAQAALYFASKYKIHGLILCSITHRLKFPFNIPGIGMLKYFKKNWKKHYHPNEVELRKKAVYYDAMPSKALAISEKLTLLCEEGMSRITAPIFFVHSTKERLGSASAIDEIRKIVKSSVVVSFVTDCANHNLFYSEKRKEVIKEIKLFIEECLVLEKPDFKQKASAIIPAYNEAGRIKPVLEALSAASLVEEIVLIDDGSSDNLQEVASHYSKVKYFKNPINKGKGYSLDRGVRLAKNDVIFFCDADLIGFKPEHAEAIILPVLKNETEMFIGMRGNFMQKTVKAWGLNSGERALRKEIWHNLPKFYKYRYRVEAGLNYYVNHYYGGLKWKMFDYVQPIKEKKYGFLKGTFLRWWMNLDVISSYLSYGLISRLEKKK